MWRVLADCIARRKSGVYAGQGVDRCRQAPCRSRDAAIYTIFEGTSEIQRLVIARTLSGMPIR
ncbi:acyl-CoA dehydrogenase family protein [Streptomyces sp. NPDC006207]